MAYNGWTNRRTWNVALWIGNDEGLYNIARDIARHNDSPDSISSYALFVAEMRELGSIETPDGIAWNDSGLDTDELDNMMAEL